MAGITNKQADGAALAAITIVDGIVDGIAIETDKIDGAAVDGLLGVYNSLAYKVHEIEKHIHGLSRSWGAVAVPDETNAIDQNVDRPFVAVSGNNAYGAAIPIIGSADKPTANAADAYFDLHKIAIVDSDDNTLYRLRVIYGTGTSADAIAAGQWSELLFKSGTGPQSSPVAIEVMMPRVAVGTKCWAQVWNATNLSEVDFQFKCHGYAG